MSKPEPHNKSLVRGPRRRKTAGWRSAWKWLFPGLAVKRWLSLAMGGVLLMLLGIAIWTELTPIFRLKRLIDLTLRLITTWIPNKVSGPLVTGIGLAMVVLGFRSAMRSIEDVLIPEGDEALVDKLLLRRRLSRGPRIVVLGAAPAFLTCCEG